MNNQKTTDGRRNNGRPSGTLTTETSDLVARLRAARGMTQVDFSVLIGVREPTVRNYERKTIIPIKGKTREVLEKLAHESEVPIRAKNDD